MNQISSGDVDVLVEDIDTDLGNVDYSKWHKDCMISESLINGLEKPQVDKLASAISEQISANVYYLMMRTNGDYEIFSKNSKFGVLCDIVDKESMQGKMRYHYLRLDTLTKMLFSKYPNEIVEISKLLKQGNFETTNDNSVFKIGKYTVD